MKLDRVTITGADDSIEVRDLAALTKKYPFVEWGILFSASRQGTPRYPSATWLKELHKEHLSLGMLSAHLCGQWVRDLVLESNFTFKQEDVFRIFQRVQLNFHGQYHKGRDLWWMNLSRNRDKQYILQFDGVNDEFARQMLTCPDFSAVPLFDKSGGAGVVPGMWPKAIPGVYCGYAGGLGPENIVEEINRILAVAGHARVWIDMETRVRSEDDQKFDLAKVERCLELAAPFVTI